MSEGLSRNSYITTDDGLITIEELVKNKFLGEVCSDKNEYILNTTFKKPEISKVFRLYTNLGYSLEYGDGTQIKTDYDFKIPEIGDVIKIQRGRNIWNTRYVFLGKDSYFPEYIDSNLGLLLGYICKFENFKNIPNFKKIYDQVFPEDSQKNYDFLNNLLTEDGFPNKIMNSSRGAVSSFVSVFYELCKEKIEIHTKNSIISFHLQQILLNSGIISKRKDQLLEIDNTSISDNIYATITNIEELEEQEVYYFSLMGNSPFKSSCFLIK